jgi:hypothetical protein
MTPEKEHDPFERALTEYRVRNWDPTDFCDLPFNIQEKIRKRANQLQQAEDRLKAASYAA